MTQEHTLTRTWRAIVMVSALSLAALVLPSKSAAGTASVCNETSTPVRVAVGIENVFSRSWGWERIRPNQCKDVAGRFNGGYLYLYIEYLDDPFSTTNRVFRPEHAEFATYCVNPKNSFDYLYNNQGCADNLVSRRFFEVYSESGNYELTIR